MALLKFEIRIFSENNVAVVKFVFKNVRLGYKLLMLQ